MKYFVNAGHAQNARASDGYETMNVIDTLKNYYADSLSIENGLISTSELIEENQTLINDIQYQTIAKGLYEFDSTFTANIYSVATQCPLEGGKYVIIAQGIYHLINDTIVFNSDTCCQQSSPRIGKDLKPIGSSIIFPNPASHSATLKYHLPDLEDGWLIVSDMLNKEVLRIPLPSKNTNLNFSCENIFSGMYFYSIITGKEMISSGKFSIIR